MKAFLALAFLAVVCAAELEPVELPEPAAPFIEPVRVVESPDQDFIPDDNLRIVNFVDAPEVVFAADANVNQDDGFVAIAPSELESIRIYNIPQEDNIPYPYKPRLDPMWR